MEQQQFDDAYLVARTQEGHLGAFEVLVERYQVRVYRVALRMLADPHDAQYAAQDAFVHAWRGLPASGATARSRPGCIASSPTGA